MTRNRESQAHGPHRRRPRSHKTDLVTDPWTDFEANGRVKMKALPDHEVYPLTPEQLAEWKHAVKPLHDSWAEAVKKAGGDAAAIDADLQATLKKYGAGL